MFLIQLSHFREGLPGGAVVKNLSANAGDSGDVGLIRESKTSLE